MLTPIYYAYQGFPPSEYPWPAPHLGQRVIYHSKVSSVPLAALVTCTMESYDKKVGAGKLPPLERETQVHLHVFSPGSDYLELNVEPGYGKGQWAPMESL